MNRVLVVDDDTRVLSGYERILNLFVRVFTAESGEEALGLLADEGPFDAVLVDYYLPEMLGSDLLAAIAESAPGTSRLMVTGLPDVNVAVDAVNKGKVSRFLTKPCDAVTLIDSVLAGVETSVLHRADQLHARHPGTLLTTPRQTPGSSKNCLGIKHASGLRQMYSALRLYKDDRIEDACLTMEAAVELFAAGECKRENARASFWLAAFRSEVPQRSDSGREQRVGEASRALRSVLENPPAAMTIDTSVMRRFIAWAREQGMADELLNEVSAFAGVEPKAEGLRIHTMGHLWMSVAGKEINEEDWKTRKERMIFLYLLVNRHRRVDRDVLMELFWPEYDRAVAANNLSTMLYNLRGVIGNDVIHNKKGFCWLDKSMYWCDADDISLARERMLSAIKAGNTQQALANFIELRDLYKGDFLSEFCYEDWVLQEQRRLRDEYVLAVLAAGDVLLAEGQADVLEQALIDAPLSLRYSHRVVAMLERLLKQQGRGDTAAHLASIIADEYMAEYGRSLQG